MITDNKKVGLNCTWNFCKNKINKIKPFEEWLFVDKCSTNVYFETNSKTIK